MLASPGGRSRLVWIVALGALLLAIRLCAGGGDDDTGPAAGTATSGAATAGGASGHEASWVAALIRSRRVALATLAVTPGTLRLEGIALDPAHRPIAGARITLGDGARTTESAADGAFFFDDLAEGTYALRGEVAGAYGEDLAADLTETSAPVELELRRGPSIDVRVVDARGEPVPGARVESANRGGLTGPDGHVLLRGLDVGSAYVTVTAAGYAPTNDFVDAGDDPAAVVTAVLTLVRGSAIGGLVVDEAGTPVADAAVEVGQPHGRRERASTDAHGVWTVGDLATGSYLVTATSAIHVATAPQEILHDSARGQAGLVVRVEAGAEVHGLVVDTHGAPVREASVSAGRRAARTDEHGVFTLTGLVAGTYDVYAYTDRATSASQEVAVVRRGTAPLRLVVQPTNIAGIVVNSRGVPLEDVRVMAASDGPHGRRSDRTDEHGHFELGQLPPGAYVITASRDDEHDRQDPDTGVVVTAGTRSVRIVLPDLSSVHGRVVLDGAPVPYFGFMLSVVDEPRFESPAPVREPGGTFRVDGLRAGTRTLVLVGPSFVTRTIRNIRVGAGEDRDLGDLVVEAGRTVHGRVTTAGGSPVAGAQVAIHTSGRSASDDALAGRVRDRYVARTDAMGAYTLAGIAPREPDGSPLMIEATAPAMAMLERELADTETDVDLVLVGTGIIAGTMAPTDTARALVVATEVGTEGSTIYANPDASGAFAFDPLPAGTYRVRVSGPWNIAARLVTVTAGDTVRIPYPSFASAAVVHVRWPGCMFLALQDLDSPESLTGEVCADGAATLTDVVAGTYRLCDGETCKTIVVPATPEVTIDGP